MGVQLNIKSAEAKALALELADMTGESITQVVIDALKARKRVLTKDERLARVMAIANDCAGRLSEPWKSVDHGDLLYDETGMPK
jgi:antitoxin VapB